jgi:uncharacterized repeat protein (TIGR01451 family)
VNKRIRQLFLVLGLSFVAIFAALALLTLPVRAADQCVAPGGAGGCHASIQAAVDAASSGDTVRVVAGTYTENIGISKDLTLLGGFDDTTLTSRTPRSSIINGGRIASVIGIFNGATVTVDGFTITGGDANGVGGGIAIFEANAIIRDNLIEDNVASRDPAVFGQGGAIFGQGSNAIIIIEGNTIQGNIGNGAGGNAVGGGIELAGATAATITNNSIIQNIAVISGSFGNGGGISTANVQKLTLTGNWVMSNTALVNGFSTDTPQSVIAMGGGVAVNGSDAFNLLNDSLSLEDNHIIGNTAAQTVTTSGNGASSFVIGGGLWINGISSTQIISNEVRKNTVAESLSITGNGGWGGGTAGGGLYLNDNDIVTAHNNQFVDNITIKQYTVSAVSSGSAGGGFSLNDVENATIISNTITGNTDVMMAVFSSDSGENYFSEGGGASVSCFGRPNCAISFEANLVADNVAADTIIISGTNAIAGGFGGGIRALGTPAVTLTNNTIVQNVASKTAPNGQGGGLNLLAVGTGLLQSNLISGNVGHLSGNIGGGGAMEIAESTIEMNQNRILGNQTTASGSGTPAVWVWQGNVTSTNDIIAYNYGGIGLGTDGVPARVMIINDTLYDNGSIGIEAGGSASTLHVTNTIVYGHADGLRLNDLAATFSGDYNLLSNTNNYAGGVSGGANDILNQDPLFVNVAAGDFSLTSSSPAIDTGKNGPCPIIDHRGVSRPVDGDGDGTATCDIGAFEAIPDLAISKRGPASGSATDPVTYTLIITNDGSAVASNLAITDAIPAKATYVGGGTPVGNVVSWTVASLAGGGGVTQTTFVVTALETITNSDYHVSASGGFSATGDVMVVTVIDQPSLAVSKSGPTRVSIGEPIAYTLTITNNGSGAARDLVIRDAMPTNAHYINGGTLVGNVVSWTVDSLAAGGGVIQTSFIVTATETITNSDYGVSARGGFSAQGTISVETNVLERGGVIYLPMVVKN